MLYIFLSLNRRIAVYPLDSVIHSLPYWAKLDKRALSHCFESVFFLLSLCLISSKIQGDGYVVMISPDDDDYDGYDYHGIT